jgi:hypothetical protein
MVNRIFWSIPANTTVSLFKIFSAASPAAIAAYPQLLQSTLQQFSFVPGALAPIGSVPANQSGPNFDSNRNQFFFDDAQGTASTVYQVQGYGQVGLLLADSGIFQCPQVQAANLVTRVKVDHNYGGPDNLRYLATNGAAVPNATIRGYKQADFLAGRSDLALAVTQTDTDGRWLAPFFLEPGLTYSLVFGNPGVFGPDLVSIIV